MKTEIIALLSGLLGALIGSAGAIAATWIRAHYDEKKHQSETILKIASDNFKQACEIAKVNNGVDYPFDVFLVHALSISERLGKGKISEHNIKEIFGEVDTIVEESLTYFREKEEKLGKKSQS